MQVQKLAEEWIEDYNCNRLHQILGGKTPMEYDAVRATFFNYAKLKRLTKLKQLFLYLKNHPDASPKIGRVTI